MKEQKIINRLQNILYDGNVIKSENEIERLKNDYQLAKEQAKREADSLVSVDSGFDDELDDLLKKIQIKKENILLRDKNKKALIIGSKKEIIRDLKRMVDNTNDIGKSYEQIKGIQQRWSDSGRLFGDEGIELQNEFNYHAELFFHNININKDLRDLDYQKNLKAKKEILEKFKEVPQIEDIRQLEGAQRRIQGEWRSAGPVPWDLKDDINNQFNEINDVIKVRTDAYYEERREEFDKKLAEKIALCEKIHNIRGKNITNNKTWKTNTEEVLLIQKEWRTIGYSSENETIWNVFRNACDAFFEQKRQFFAELDSKRAENSEKKMNLIQLAESIQDDDAWKVTTNKFLKLQKDWKEIGPATIKDESKLWNRFRNACDKFFLNKREFFTSQDDVQVENLEKKEAIIASIESLEVGTDSAEEFRKLKELSSQWNEIGYVPFDKKDEIIKKYRAVMEDKYKQLKLNEEQRRKLEFETRIKHLVRGEGGGNADRILSAEKTRLREKMEKLKLDIGQYENNLGFFGKNIDENNPLVKDIHSKIGRLKTQLAHMKSQLVAMNNADQIVNSAAGEEE